MPGCDARFIKRFRRPAMTSLPLPILATSLRRRLAAPWVCAVLALGALGAQAATTQGGGADAAPAALGTGTRTLDRALGGDVSTGDRNLDLLLESQRKAGEGLLEAPTSQPVPDRPAAGRPLLQALPQAATGVQAPMGPEAARRYEPGSLALPEPGQLGSAGLPAPRAARDWSGGTAPAPAAKGPGGSIYGDTSGLRTAARPLRELIQEGLAFLQDHAIAIVLTIAAIALLAMGLKAYSRRI